MAGKKIKEWTVIILNDTTGEVMTCVQETGEPHEAIAITARDVKTRDGWGDIQVVCAVAGDCMVIMPCEDADKACYVADLGNEDEQEVSVMSSDDYCECGRKPEECTTFDDAEANHGDR